MSIGAQLLALFFFTQMPMNRHIYGGISMDFFEALFKALPTAIALWVIAALIGACIYWGGMGMYW